ncbi:MAG: ribonuclease P [Candidatus Lokiarchaeota archaeon]|nr:ribonuclease P [Candidatus Lokiarchaeota archaeon]MBD3199944.1 ribonuclease P [Candidatus Lokiarchaeota archaeon]
MGNFRKVSRKIAKSRMLYLFKEADKIFSEDKELANSYSELARKYAQRAKLNIPPQWRRRICNRCKRFLYPGRNCRIRLQSRRGKASHISVTCQECGSTTRFYIKTAKK